MQGRTGCADVIDFFWEWQRRRTDPCSKQIADYTLDKCEETFQRHDWKEFGRWYTIYCRERNRSRRSAS
jgi:hypothetical protein